MKPTDMSLTSRTELANKFDEMLESVEKENTAFLITNAGKKDLVLCSVDWFEPYNDMNFGLIVNASIRYSLGRKTYMPSTVSDFAQKYMKMLDNITIEVIIEDIMKEIEYCQDKTPQLAIWLNLQERAMEEKKQRQAEGRWL